VPLNCAISGVTDGRPMGCKLAWPTKHGAAIRLYSGRCPPLQFRQQWRAGAARYRLCWTALGAFVASCWSPSRTPCLGRLPGVLYLITVQRPSVTAVFSRAAVRGPTLLPRAGFPRAPLRLPGPGGGAPMATDAPPPAVDAELDAPAANPPPRKGALTPTRGSSLAGETLATYRWDPPPPAPACGVVFLLHGIFAHCRFEFLDSDAANARTRYVGSVVEALNGAGLVVIGHDYVGHGDSTGLRGYFDSIDTLVDGALAVIDSVLGEDGAPAAATAAGANGAAPAGGDAALAGLPVFLAGMSLGGAVAVLTSLRRPTRFAGVAVFSPAVHPPADMFGLKGHVLAALSGLLSSLMPTLPVLQLPPSPFPKFREAVELDPLFYHGGVRCRVGREMLRLYGEVGVRRGEVRGRWLVCSGAKDVIVSAEGIHAWVAGVVAGSTEGGAPGATVTERRYDGMGHDLLREEGTAQVRADFVSWVKGLL